MEYLKSLDDDKISKNTEIETYDKTYFEYSLLRNIILEFIE